MTSPTKDIRTISDARIAADKPLDQQLMTDIRDALVNLSEQISYGYTPSQAHTHNGVDSALLPANNAANLFNFTHFN